MSEETAPEPKAKKKGSKVKTFLVGTLAVLVLGGGGAAAGYFAAPKVNIEHGSEIDPDRPKLVPKDGSEPVAAIPRTDPGHVKPKLNESAFKATYYSIEAPFTSNLQDSSSFAQMSLAVATYYDERVLENIQEHETAIRSAVLMTMAEQDSITLGTQTGQETLQGLLTTAINNTLEEKSGFGGIDNVYFTSFVVQ